MLLLFELELKDDDGNDPSLALHAHLRASQCRFEIYPPDPPRKRDIRSKALLARASICRIGLGGGRSNRPTCVRRRPAAIIMMRSGKTTQSRIWESNSRVCVVRTSASWEGGCWEDERGELLLGIDIVVVCLLSNRKSCYAIEAAASMVKPVHIRSNATTTTTTSPSIRQSVNRPSVRPSRSRSRSPRIGVRDGQTNVRKIFPFVCLSSIPTQAAGGSIWRDNIWA